MAAMTEITCECGCDRKKMVRQSDIKRGWGRFYSKACKAKSQTRQNDPYSSDDDSWDYEHPFASGEDGHGQF